VVVSWPTSLPHNRSSSNAVVFGGNIIDSAYYYKLRLAAVAFRRIMSSLSFLCANQRTNQRRRKWRVACFCLLAIHRSRLATESSQNAKAKLAKATGMRNFPSHSKTAASPY
jgi:hypothetical protein